MTPTAAAALVCQLESSGVDVVFGLPGVHNLAVFEALDRSPLATVVVRHEATAAYAADGYARATGRPAVCLTTSGPGAANTAAAMGEAWASSSPLLHLTTTVASKHAGPGGPRGVLHGHPRQLDVLEPLSKLALRCEDPAELAGLAARCLAAAVAPPAAPAYLEVPFDLLDGEAGGVAPWASPASPQAPPAPDPAAIAAAAAVLAGAERPLVWAGSGSLGAVDAVIAVAERLDAPVVLTHSAKRRFGAVSHPLVLTQPPHEPAVTEMVEAAGAALVVGSDLDAMMTQEFALRLPQALVQLDVDPGQIGRRYPVAAGVEAPAEAALPALLGQLPRRSHGTEAALADLRARLWDGLARDEATAPAIHLLDALDLALPGDAVVACDMAVAGYWAAGYLPLRPARQLLYPMGWGTLGFALPAAIGAAAGSPERRTVVICGDAGLLFAAGDLATAVQEGLPLTVIVVNDGGYGMLRYDERRRFGRTFAADLATPDFVRLAEAFGIPARCAELADPALPAQIEHSLGAPGPALLELRGALVPPRITSPRWPARER